MPFTVLPTPGERLLIPGRAGCHVTVIYRVIKDCKLSTVSVADRQLIAETEVDRFIRERPSSSNRGGSVRWREYCAWKAGRGVAKPGRAE